MQRMFEYHYNIIHDGEDTDFAYDLDEFLKRKFPNIKGFYSDLRLPGKQILPEAIKEIQCSKVNICLARISMDKTVLYIQKNAVKISLDSDRLDQLIFVAHGGHNAATVSSEYGLLETNRVIEFIAKDDPQALDALRQQVERALFQRTAQPPTQPPAQPHPRANNHNLVYSRGDMYQSAGKPPQRPSGNNFGDLMAKVVKELVDEDVKPLKFLLSNVSQQKLDGITTGQELLEYMINEGVISSQEPRFLIEALEIVDSNRLAKEIRESPVVSHVHNQGQGVAPFRKMLHQVANSLGEEEVRKMKSTLTSVFQIPPRILSSAKDFMDLFTILEQQGIISSYDMQETYVFLQQNVIQAFARTAIVKRFIEDWYTAEKFQVDGNNRLVSVDGPLPDTVPDLLDRWTNLTESQRQEFMNRVDENSIPDVGLQEMTYADMRSYYEKEMDKKLIGKGGFGNVYQAVKKYKGLDVVVKQNNDDGDYEMKRTHFVKERDIAYVKHPFILPLLAAAYDNKEQRLLLMYPYMPNHDLENILSGNSTFMLRWDDLLRILWQTSCALAFYHKQIPGVRPLGIRHGDVKLSNILLDKDKNARLADAGLAEEMQKSSTTTKMSGSTFYIDTYMRHKGKIRKSVENDVFSFGIVMREVIPHLRNPVRPAKGVSMGDLEEDMPISLAGVDQETLKTLSVLESDCRDPPRYWYDWTRTEITRDTKVRPTMKTVCDKLKKIVGNEDRNRFGKNKKCVMCMVNDQATQLEAWCGCTWFCQVCHKMAFRNPLECPLHGLTQPAIGHEDVYAVLIGGSDEKMPLVFIRDVDAMYRTITDPNIMGIRKNNVYRLINEDNEKRKCYKCTKENLKSVFTKLKSELETKRHASLVLYVSAHADNVDFKLMNEERIARAELQNEVDQLNLVSQMLIFDTCYAGNVAFIGPMSNSSSNNDVTQQLPLTSLENPAIPLPVQALSEDKPELVITKADGTPGDANSPQDDRCKIQFSSSGRQQKSLTFGGESIFTKYLIAGLQSGHSCMPRKEEKVCQKSKACVGAQGGNSCVPEDEKEPQCHLCKEFVRMNENKDWININDLSYYVIEHMKVDKITRANQEPTISAINCRTLRHAYFNKQPLHYLVKFRDLDEKLVPLELRRHPMYYPSLPVLQEHLWNEIVKKNLYPDIGQQFLQIGCVIHDHGKEDFREFGSGGDVEGYTKDQLQCRLRSDIRFFYQQRPILHLVNGNFSRLMSRSRYRRKEGSNHIYEVFKNDPVLTVQQPDSNVREVLEKIKAVHDLVKVMDAKSFTIGVWDCKQDKDKPQLVTLEISVPVDETTNSPCS